jgi:hypothetical protein
MPSRARSTMTTSASHPPSTLSTPSTIAPHAMDPSKASVLHGAGAAKPSPSNVPTGRTSNINHAGDLVDDDDDKQVFGSEHTAECNTKTYVVQWVLSAHVD